MVDHDGCGRDAKGVSQLLDEKITCGNMFIAASLMKRLRRLSVAQAWPQLLAALPPFAGVVTPEMTCVDGTTLAEMAAAYQGVVHPISPVVTGRAGVLFISIYSNDAATMIANYGSLAGYEASYAQYLSTAIADGWKIGFLAPWAEAGRQQYDSLRLAFNQYNETSPQVTYYLDFTGTMNNPSDATYYEADGQHENVLGNAEIAVLGQAVLMLATAGTANLTVVTPGASPAVSDALPVSVH